MEYWSAQTIDENDVYVLTFGTTLHFIKVKLKNSEVQYVTNYAKIFDSQNEVYLTTLEGDRGIRIGKKEGENEAGFIDSFLTLDDRVLDDFKAYIESGELEDHEFEVDITRPNIANTNSEYDFEQSLANAYSQPSRQESPNRGNETLSDPEHVTTQIIVPRNENDPENSNTDPNLHIGGKRRKRFTVRRRRGGKKSRKYRNKFI